MDNSLGTSFWVMVLLQTFGAVDMPGSGNRKMPAPRHYVPTIITWSVLGVVADVWQERAAAAAGWVMVLAAMVVGPFGTKAVSFLTSVAQQFGTAATSVVSTPTPTPTTEEA